MIRISAGKTRQGRGLLLCHAFLLCLPLILYGVVVFAETKDEYAVKSAFIANFILLTEWPDDRSSKALDDVTLCIVGGASLPEPFQALEGKKVGTKTLHVVTAAPDTTLPDCQVVFYMQDVDTENLVRTLQAVRFKPVLTIGEKSNVTRLGGTMHFYEHQERLRFAVNLRVVAEQKLKMSSRLLQIATLIDD
jgi:hypothetical protein